MRQCIIVCLVLIGLSVSSAQAITYGGNLLGDDPNGPSGFGDLTDWSISSGCSQTAEIYRSAPYSLKMEHSAGYWKSATIVIDNALPNRYYFWKCHFRHSGSGSVNANQAYFNGVQLFSEESYSNLSWKPKYGSEWLEADETSITFKVQSPMGDSGYTNRIAYWDDIELRREAVSPEPIADSQNGLLATGQANTIMLSVSAYPASQDIMRLAFDPDLQITATNAAVDGVTVIDDYTAVVTITPAANGPVNLTLTNVYSGQSAGYAMTALTPANCGDPGTLYSQADLIGSRDCYVDLGDFAILSQQWLECTDAENLTCDFSW